jgi:hypothetical protein
MNRARAIRIGNRINIVLHRQLHVGIDVKRLIENPLYARDVLLVCDAMPGTDLVALARDFRRALTESAEEFESSWGFDVTRPATDSELPDEQAERRARTGWFTPGRWLSR